MAMKETERSLTWYFVIAGALSALFALGTLSELTKFPSVPAAILAPIWYASLSRLALGIGYVAAGLTLKKALLSGARWIQYLVLASGASLVLELLWHFAGSQGSSADGVGVSGGFVGIAIRLAIVTYLYFNIRRLSTEAQVRVASTTFE